MSHETVADTFAMSPAFARLDGRIVSGHEGVMKPDPAILHALLTRFGIALSFATALAGNVVFLLMALGWLRRARK